MLERPYLFNSTVLSAMLYASEKWANANMEEQIFTAKGVMERFMLGISRHEWCKSGAEWSEGRDYGIPKTEFPQGRTLLSVVKQQVNLCSFRVETKKPEND